MKITGIWPNDTTEGAFTEIEFVRGLEARLGKGSIKWVQFRRDADSMLNQLDGLAERITGEEAKKESNKKRVVRVRGNKKRCRYYRIPTSASALVLDLVTFLKAYDLYKSTDEPTEREYYTKIMSSSITIANSRCDEVELIDCRSKKSQVLNNAIRNRLEKKQKAQNALEWEKKQEPLEYIGKWKSRAAKSLGFDVRTLNRHLKY